MVVFIILCLICLGTYKYLILTEIFKSWDDVKPHLEGELRIELKKLYELSEEEYWQTIVGIWVIANIETEDAKKLIKLSGNSYKEKNEAKMIARKILDMQQTIIIVEGYMTPRVIRPPSSS